MWGTQHELAGFALLPGGFAILLAMPLVGFLLGRYDARMLLLFGLTVLSIALFRMERFDLQIDFHSVAMARVLQNHGEPRRHWTGDLAHPRRLARQKAVSQKCTARFCDILRGRRPQASASGFLAGCDDGSRDRVSAPARL